VRIVALFMMLAVTGVQNSAYAAARDSDAMRAADEAAHAAAQDTHDVAEGDDCGDEDCGCDGPCSPLCDKCTCALGGRSLPAFAASLVVPIRWRSVEAPLALAPVAPRAPDRAGIFHPPRG
jgi:hypothetical protein